MSQPRVLVVFKKSVYEVEVELSGARSVDALIRDENPAVERILDAHEAHHRSMDRARRVLEGLGVDVVYRTRDEVRTVEGFDLVVTLGGDGTLLWTSHHVGPDVQMLGINTAPRDSVGYFCAGRGDQVDEILPAALEGRLPATRLTRMRVLRDDEVLTERVLNDVLFSHPCPAATTRYILGLGEVDETQRSSGLWVGPAAGSTAAQHSAGGDVLPLESRWLQFVVREPYDAHDRGLALRRGLVPPGDGLRILNKMTDARIYVDGYHREHEVGLGALVRMCESPEPLTLLGLGPRRQVTRDPEADAPAG